MAVMRRLGLSALTCALFAVGCSSADSGAPPQAGAGSSGGAGASEAGAGGHGAGANAGTGSSAGAEAGNAGGASGAAGEDGGAGSAGSSGAGSSGTGSTTEYAGSHCSPGEPSEPMLSLDENDCHDVSTYHAIPNGEAAFVESYPLPAPMVAGEPYSFSIEILHTGERSTVEFWGTDVHCGSAQELLYWGETSGDMIHCATFTPTRAHTEVLVATRRLKDNPVSFRRGQRTSCGAGAQCSEPTGQALAPGVTLDAPLGDYTWVGGAPQRSGTEDLFISSVGRLIVVLDGPVGSGEPRPVMHGLFRAPPASPFGDAWYCIGADSTFMRFVDDDLDEYHASLRNMTRVECPAGGTGTLSSLHAASELSITSSLAELSFASSDRTYGFICTGRYCNMSYRPSSALDAWIFFTTETAVGSRRKPPPDPLPIDIVDSFVFYAPVDGSAPSFLCGASGSIVYGGDEAADVMLLGLSGPDACPGVPIEDDATDLVID